MLGRLKNIVLGLGIMGSVQTFFADIPLFQQYPALQSYLPHVQLGQWPTPIQPLNTLAKQLNIPKLFIKREDLSGKLFGGNKVRKLEFLLADALKNNYKTVLAYGGIASNNVTTVAAYSKQFGLQSMAFLFPQPITRNLKRNIMLDYAYGCLLFECPYDRELTHDELQEFLRAHNLDAHPYVIPMGGSNKIGVVGWVNAVFELKQQIAHGVIYEPDYMYITMGSLGTTAGLLLGIKAAGLKTKLRAVQVTNPEKYSKEKLCHLIQETNALLHASDPTFALYKWTPEEFDIITNYLGQGYACKTSEGESARDLFKISEGITLDETYTAKTAAALIHDCQSGAVQPTDVVLFWHTYCADDFQDITAKIDCGQLPVVLQKYLQ